MARRNTTRVVIALNQFTSRETAKLAIDITENLYEATPKDTGWAAANWRASIGSPAQTNAASVKNPTTSNAAAARSVQLGTIEQFRSYNIRSGKSLFVTNDVPYISLLNAGSSQQAPSAFVQKAIAAAVIKANRSKGF